MGSVKKVGGNSPVLMMVMKALKDKFAQCNEKMEYCKRHGAENGSRPAGRGLGC